MTAAVDFRERSTAAALARTSSVSAADGTQHATSIAQKVRLMSASGAPGHARGGQTERGCEWDRRRAGAWREGKGHEDLSEQEGKEECDGKRKEHERP